MHGDLTRDSYDSAQQFTRVILQQGRLLVDADWNEQSTIIFNYLQSLAADIIGWHAGPGVTKNAQDAPENGALAIKKATGTAGDGFTVAEGRYYVRGQLVQHSASTLPKKADIKHDVGEKPPTGAASLLLFADVSERLVTGTESNELLDPAFNGLDTAARLKTELHIRGYWFNATAAGFSEQEILDQCQNEEKFRKLLNYPVRKSGEFPQLKAWVTPPVATQKVCVSDADTGYTGLENQLYRVEVQQGSKYFWTGQYNAEKKPIAADGTPLVDNDNIPLTIKWSRENGSVVYAGKMGNGTVRLAKKWRDEVQALRQHDWIELLPLGHEVGELVSVKDVRLGNDGVDIDLDTTPAGDLYKPGREVLVRRWDHRSRQKFPLFGGGMLVPHAVGDATTSLPIPLEDGVTVQLLLPKDAEFRAGDYWLIPARANTGTIIWPRDPSKTGAEAATLQPARTTPHQYAPLALITDKDVVIDLRRPLWGISDAPPPPKVRTLPFAAALTIDLSQGDIFIVEVTAAITSIALTKGVLGKRWLVRWKNSTGGALAIAGWPAAVTGAGAIASLPSGPETVIELLQTGDAKWFATVVE